MPLPLSAGAPTLVVKRAAFERTGITRAQIDQALTLTDEEFRVEHGLVYFDDFFEMSGNWPDWLSVFTLARG